MNSARKLWERGRDLLPVTGFHFDRPVVLLQSDDWGRVGLRDQEGLEQLRSAGLQLGEFPYDSYTLETAEDLAALSEVLNRHRDSTGRHPCIGMNFILANPDFAKMQAGGFRKIHLLPLADGLPQGWDRPGLLDGYRAGVARGSFYPCLHGSTHFCRPAVERHLAADGERAILLRKLWSAGTPYIFPRMPWIGYEYWDPEQPESERFLSRDKQRDLVGQTVGAFAKLFSTLPKSACAPGYRANGDTHRAWALHGIQVAQNGPGSFLSPRFDRHGILHVSRTLEFEPATSLNFSLDSCVHRAEACFKHGVPAIIAAHSINFHSTISDYRSGTLDQLDRMLSIFESNHPDLLYLHDGDLLALVNTGSYAGRSETVRVKVEKRTTSRAALARWREL
jgi:hypothetical protein